MQIPAKVDYGLRALLELTARGQPVSAETVAGAQGLPPKFLVSILSELKRAGLITTRRGTDGGYQLGRPPGEITVADVIRALDGPLAEVRGLRPEDTAYQGTAAHLQQLWIATRASLRNVLEHVTLDDIATGKLPTQVTRLVADPDAWHARAR